MNLASNITLLWSIFKDVANHLSGRADKKKGEIINAHKAINTAFIKTYGHLKIQKGQYLPSPELAEIWNQASAEVMKVDKDLGNLLFYKSRFWTDPQLFIDVNREAEIIQLTEVIDEMEKLRRGLK